jgi:hypothetical protein
MKVETYECEETKMEVPQESEEAVRLIDELGLEGQQVLVSKKKDATEIQRCPYRKIRADEEFVYRLLCPQSIELKRFDEMPIPLRVLQVIAHAKSLNIFQTFQIWCARGAIKDPVLVASTKDYIYSSDRDTFILARWGEELDEFAVLLKKAIEKWKEKAKSTIAKCIVKANQDLQLIDFLDAESIISKNEPYYNGLS